MSSGRPVPYDPIARQVRILGYAVAVMIALMLVGMGAGFYVTVNITHDNKANIRQVAISQQRIRKLTEDGLQAKNAICAYKESIQESVDASEQYFDDVRAGRRPPITGLSIADLQASLSRQRDVLRALSTLRCPDKPAPK